MSLSGVDLDNERRSRSLTPARCQPDADAQSARPPESNNNNNNLDDAELPPPPPSMFESVTSRESGESRSRSASLQPPSDSCPDQSAEHDASGNSDAGRLAVQPSADRRSRSSQDAVSLSASPGSATPSVTASTTPEAARRPCSTGDSTPSGEHDNSSAGNRASQRTAVASHKLSLLQARSHSQEREQLTGSCPSAVTGTDGNNDDAVTGESPLKRTQSVMSSPSGSLPGASACAHSQLHERIGKKASATQATAEDSANYELCKRLESLVLRMFDETTGVPVRTVKNFISKIPSVFTGADLVAWITKNVNVADHVDDHVLTVKPDNTYYRFQTPCLWPSRSDAPENLDYAVYLCKRTMQSRPRNELMDYEAENLARLQKTLSRKWELIYMQAEAQAKVDRKRDKVQREVLDSQERAFWDLHRPMPNAVTTMELDMRKALRKYKPSARLRDPVAAFVNTNASEQQVFKDARDRVYRLTKLLDRHRIKVSKVSETLISRGEQYAPFDALITQPDPSNPWVTDNQEYWEMEKCRTDIAQRRVQKWSFSLLELIKDPAGHEQFEKFLEREFSKENLKFWEACVRLKYAPVREIAERMRAIYVQFLAPGAAEAVNVDSKIQETVNKKLAVLYSDRYVFEEAEDHIYQLMNRDSYCRFLRSEQYKELLRTAKPPRNAALAGKRKPIAETGASTSASANANASSSGTTAQQTAASGVANVSATAIASANTSASSSSAGGAKAAVHATKSGTLAELKDANKEVSSV